LASCAGAATHTSSTAATANNIRFFIWFSLGRLKLGISRTLRKSSQAPFNQGILRGSIAQGKLKD
jgi:hypothetical protein